MRRTPGAFIDARRARRGAVAGITKRVSPRTLRASFATHLLEQNADIRLMQALLSRPKLETTALHTRVAVNAILDVTSPLERLAPERKLCPRMRKFCPSWPKAHERILASINNGRSLYAAGVRFIRRKACKSTSLTVKLSGPRSFSASTCSRTRQLESTLSGHSGSRRWTSQLADSGSSPPLRRAPKNREI